MAVFLQKKAQDMPNSASLHFTVNTVNRIQICFNLTAIPFRQRKFDWMTLRLLKQVFSVDSFHMLISAYQLQCHSPLARREAPAEGRRR